MNSSHKHFSHAHSLVLHQAHEPGKMSCSGCNSSVIGTVYVCWQCNFVLHEQCFRATRSLKHPSHPSHPLTLVPYPTYPSNSFYCNSCKLTGTGLSYSCSDCEFDLHVHCAHSYVAENVCVSTNAQNQSVQHSYIHAQHPGFVPAQTYNPNPVTNPQYSSMALSIPVGEWGSSKDSDLEHVKMNLQRLEIAREEYRLAAKRRQDILDLI